MLHMRMDDSGQVSAEMIILLAAVIAVAYVVVSSLQSTAVKTKKTFNSASNKTFERINDIIKLV